MNIVDVNTKPPYQVVIARGGLSKIGEYATKVRGVSRAVVVSDSNVAPLYMKSVLASLRDCGFVVSEYVFDAGEQSKTPATYLGIIDALAVAKLNRADVVFALGGGVVGDIAGFAAATYMRGIDVVQIPTTLLAAIDSSVGGKTGVDLTQGKNLLGAFHQPKLVLCDPDTLSTMSQDDWKNGLGEGIKYAILAAGEILDILESGLSADNLEKFISLCVALKARIVEADERESGERKLLNLGHTLGHAVEKDTDYAIPHGAAVAQGIRYMASAAQKCAELDASQYTRIINLLDKYGLESCCESRMVDLLQGVKMDKKSGVNGALDFVKIKGLGKCEVCCSTMTEFSDYILGEDKSN